MRVFFMIMASVMVFGLAGCDNPGPATTSATQWTWSMMKSPQTGRCYEVATRTSGFGNVSYAYSGMSEIPCDKMAK